MLTLRKLSALPDHPAPRALVVGSVASIVGAGLFFLSAIVMITLWIRLLYESMSWVGLLLGFLTAPIASAYPLIHWAAHSEFHLFIFGIWLAGLLGLSVTVTWVAWGRHRVLAGAAPKTPRSLAAVIAMPQDQD